MYNNAADSLVWSQVGLAQALADLINGAAQIGVLAGAKVDLWTANLTPTPQNVTADLVIPTTGSWAGYVQKTITGYGATRTDTTGVVSADATPLMEWVGPAAGGGPTVYGYAVSSAAGQLLYTVKFAVPVNMTTSANVLDIVPTFKMNPLVP